MAAEAGGCRWRGAAEPRWRGPGPSCPCSTAPRAPGKCGAPNGGCRIRARGAAAGPHGGHRIGERTAGAVPHTGVLHQRDLDQLAHVGEVRGQRRRTGCEYNKRERPGICCRAISCTQSFETCRRRLRHPCAPTTTVPRLSSNLRCDKPESRRVSLRLVLRRFVDVRASGARATVEAYCSVRPLASFSSKSGQGTRSALAPRAAASPAMKSASNWSQSTGEAGLAAAAGRQIPTLEEQAVLVSLLRCTGDLGAGDVRAPHRRIRRAGNQTPAGPSSWSLRSCSVWGGCPGTCCAGA